MSDGLMVKPELAARAGVTLQPAGELVERLQGWVLGKVGKPQPHVVSVMERIFWQSVGLEMMDELFVGHWSYLKVAK
jgi:hypothetical protein